MAAGDAQRVWFPEMIERLRFQWHQGMSFDAIIDLRDELAYKKGHIITAKHMLPTQLLADTKIAQDKPILLACQSGYQSPGVGRQLRQKGFQKVYYLAGGIENWQSAGLLLTKGK